MTQLQHSEDIMSCTDSLSVADSLLCGDDVPDPDVPAPSGSDSLPTFQMFREKKAKVEAELRYHYRSFQIILPDELAL